MKATVDPTVNESTAAWFQDARETAAVFAGLIAIGLSCLYCLLRWGFDGGSLTRVMQTLPLGLFLVSFSPFCRRTATAFGVNADRAWIGQDGMLSLIALGIIIGAGAAAGHLGIQTALLWRVGGFGLFLFVCTCWFRRGSVVATIAFVAISLLFSLWVAGAVWGWGYQNPLYEESLIGGYYLCKDIFLPASIANMLKTYGAASFGVDGLVYCYYHWGAYWIFAQLSWLIDTSQINFSQLCFPVMFIPFFLCRFIGFAIDVRESLGQGAATSYLRRDTWFWLLLFAAFIGFIPTEGAEKMALGFDREFVSETYAVALGVTFATLSVLTGFIKKGLSNERPALSDRIVICSLPALLIGIGLIKVSLMFLLFLMLGYLVFRLRLWTHIAVSCSLLVSAVAMAIVVKLTVAPGESGFHLIYPFGFFISNIQFDWKPLWLLFFFFWSWLFMVWMLRADHIYTLADLATAYREKRILAVELVAVVCLLGSGPAMLFAIPGGSGVYFMDFQTWLSSALLLGHLSNLRERTFGIRTCRATSGNRVANMPLSKILAGVATVLLIWMLLANGALAVWRMIDFNLGIRCRLMPPSAPAICSEPLGSQAAKAAASLRSMDPGPLVHLIRDQVMPLIGAPGRQLDKAEHWRIIEALRRLAEIPVSQKKDTAVYVPRTNALYWSLSPQCEVAPFFVPAIAGMAMIGGVPGPDCRSTGWAHHYSPYRLVPEKAEASGDDQEALICSRARAKGFSRVIVLDQNESGEIEMKDASCHQVQ